MPAIPSAPYQHRRLREARHRKQRIERVFGHLKRNLGLRTLKLRSLAGAAEEFTMTVSCPLLSGPSNMRVWIKTDQARRMKDLEKENLRLRRAISDLTLDKLILQEATRGNF